MTLDVIYESDFSEPKIIQGRIRQLKNMVVFWPCSIPYPHYSFVESAARIDLDRYFSSENDELITVVGALSKKSHKGMDGAVRIYAIVTNEWSGDCFDKE